MSDLYPGFAPGGGPTHTAPSAGAAERSFLSANGTDETTEWVTADAIRSMLGLGPTDTPTFAGLNVTGTVNAGFVQTDYLRDVDNNSWLWNDYQNASNKEVHVGNVGNTNTIYLDTKATGAVSFSGDVQSANGKMVLSPTTSTTAGPVYLFDTIDNANNGNHAIAEFKASGTSKVKIATGGMYVYGIKMSLNETSIDRNNVTPALTVSNNIGDAVSVVGTSTFSDNIALNGTGDIDFGTTDYNGQLQVRLSRNSTISSQASSDQINYSTYDHHSFYTTVGGNAEKMRVQHDGVFVYDDATFSGTIASDPTGATSTTKLIELSRGAIPRFTVTGDGTATASGAVATPKVVAGDGGNNNYTIDASTASGGCYVRASANSANASGFLAQNTFSMIAFENRGGNASMFDYTNARQMFSVSSLGLMQVNQAKIGDAGGTFNYEINAYDADSHVYIGVESGTTGGAGIACKNSMGFWRLRFSGSDDYAGGGLSSTAHRQRDKENHRLR